MKTAAIWCFRARAGKSLAAAIAVAAALAAPGFARADVSTHADLSGAAYGTTIRGTLTCTISDWSGSAVATGQTSASVTTPPLDRDGPDPDFAGNGIPLPTCASLTTTHSESASASAALAAAGGRVDAAVDSAI